MTKTLEEVTAPTPEQVEEWIRMTSHAAIGSVSAVHDIERWNDLTAYLRFVAAPEAQDRARKGPVLIQRGPSDD